MEKDQKRRPLLFIVLTVIPVSSMPARKPNVPQDSYKVHTQHMFLSVTSIRSGTPPFMYSYPPIRPRFSVSTHPSILQPDFHRLSSFFYIFLSPKMSYVLLHVSIFNLQFLLLFIYFFSTEKIHVTKQTKGKL